MAKKLAKLLCVGLLFLHSTCFATELQEVNIRQVYLYTDVLHAYVDMVGMDGQPIATPQRNEISASIDGSGLTVRDVQSFADCDEGLAYVFLLDVSGSLSTREFKQLCNATVHWAQQMGEKDRMAILSFGDEINVVQDYTNDIDAIASSLDTLSNNGQHTRLYGGIQEALKLATRNDSGLPKRKAIILLTDGINDFVGGVSENEVLQHAKQTLIPFYSIWMPGEQSGEQFLNTLRDATNGEVYDLSNQEIDGIYQTVYQQLQQAFVVNLGYPPEKVDGLSHQITVAVRCGGKEASDQVESILNTPTETMIDIPLMDAMTTSETKGKENMGISTDLLLGVLAGALALITLIIVAFALIYHKKKSKKVTMDESPNSNNIPQYGSVPTDIQQPIQNSKRNLQFTMHEIGGSDVKEGCVTDTLIIGRNQDSGLVIQEPQVSGHHCQLFYENGNLMIEDMGSTNGTIINGIVISGRVPLPSGSLLLLGSKEYRISY